MAKIETKKKSSAGKSIACGRCQLIIQPGSMYRVWGFRVGAKSNTKLVRCMSVVCNPRASELTMNQTSGMHLLNERLSDALDDLQKGLSGQDDPNVERASKLEAFQTEVDSIKDDSSSLAEEIQEGFDNMVEGNQSGSLGETAETRISNLEEFVSELESTIDNVEWPQDKDPVDDPECKTCGQCEHDPDEEYEHEFVNKNGVVEISEDEIKSVASDFESISLEVE